MTYENFRTVRIKPHGPCSLELQLPPGSLSIPGPGSDVVSFKAPLRPGGNLHRIHDEQTFDFIHAVMAIEAVVVLSITTESALVRYRSDLDYLQVAHMLERALIPPADDPSRRLAVDVTISTEYALDMSCWPSVPTDGDKAQALELLRRHGIDATWVVLAPEPEGDEARSPFVPPGVRAQRPYLLWDPWPRFDYTKPVPEYLERLRRDPEFLRRVRALREMLEAPPDTD